MKSVCDMRTTVDIKRQNDKIYDKEKNFKGGRTMMYPYSSYSYVYNGYVQARTILIVALLVAVILAVVLYFTFLSKKNEGKFTGIKGKIYNFLCFNKFYVEDILKLLYLIVAVIITVLGIAALFDTFFGGLAIIVIGNVALRIAYELLMMFIILCRKTVSMDRKLDKIVRFYSDDFDDGSCGTEDEQCYGGCEGCPDSGEVCQDKPAESAKEQPAESLHEETEAEDTPVPEDKTAEGPSVSAAEQEINQSQR